MKQIACDRCGRVEPEDSAEMDTLSNSDSSWDLCFSCMEAVYELVEAPPPGTANAKDDVEPDSAGGK